MVLSAVFKRFQVFMETVKLRTYLFIGIGIILLFPIILNYILRIPAPFNTPIVGQSTDWLLFWASYAGGILTAGIGFVSLYHADRKSKKLIQEQREQYLYEYKNAQAKELERELIRRVESLNYWSIARIFSRLEKNAVSLEEANQEIQILKERRERVELENISWHLLSLKEISSKPKDFEKVYFLHVAYYQNCIDEAITMITSYIESNHVDAVKVREFMQDIQSKTLLLSESFVTPAKEWIQEEAGM